MDLTKAFDTLNHDALRSILGKIGCPLTFVNLGKQLQTDVKAHFTFNSSLSDESAVDNRLNQFDILVSKFFCLLCSALNTCLQRL